METEFIAVTCSLKMLFFAFCNSVFQPGTFPYRVHLAISGDIIGCQQPEERCYEVHKTSYKEKMTFPSISNAEDDKACTEGGKCVVPS